MFMPYAARVKPTASEARLEFLIQERLRPGADQAAIDRRIWALFGEQWAVMFTDLSGFSRQVAKFGIIHFLQIIYESQRLLTPCIEAQDGILLKVEADSMMVIFRTPQRALDSALHMMKVLKGYNHGRPETDQVLLCLGIGWGPVLRVGDFEVFGEEVNGASKLGEDVARAHEILLTESAHSALKERTDVSFEAHQEPPAAMKSAYRVLYGA